MQEIELLLEDSSKEDLYKSVKLYQQFYSDPNVLNFLESQIRRILGHEKCAELDCDIENIFNELHFKSKKEIKSNKNERTYVFDILEIKGKLKHAIQDKKDVNIEYFNASGENFKKFRIRPDQISGSMLDAFDYKKGEGRVFRLDRIKDLWIL